jgi:hypothetical protein
MNIEESYADKVMRIAKEKDLLYRHIYFCDDIDKEECGVYSTFNGFVIDEYGITIPVRTMEDPYKMVLIHPSWFKEFSEVI